MVDPTSLATVGLDTYRLTKPLVDIALGRSDVTRMISIIGDSVQADASIVASDRKDAAEAIASGITADPEYLGALQAFLDGGTNEVLPLLERRTAEILDTRPVVFETSTAEIARIAVETIRRDGHRAFRKDRDATHFEVAAAKNEILSQISNLSAPGGRLVFTGDASRGVERAIQALADNDASSAHLVSELVNSNDPGPLAASWCTTPPPSLDKASGYVWAVIARYAEKAGFWAESSMAWSMAQGDLGIEALLNGSVALGVIGNSEEADRLLAAAREIDPDNARVKMEAAGRMAKPADRLVAFRAISCEDESIEALRHAHIALTFLQLEDVDQAAAHVKLAEEADPTLLQTRLMRANVTIAAQRDTAPRNRRLDYHSLREAEKEALRVREELVRQRRFDESAPMVMLALDSAGLRLDSARVVEIAALPVDEELDAAALVLADAALRAGLYLKAREWARHAEDGEGKTFALESAATGLGSSDLRPLEEIVESGGEYSEFAAFQLLLNAAFSDLAWSDVASAYLEKTHESDWRSLRAHYLAHRGDVDGALATIDAGPNDDAASLARFRVTALTSDGRAIDFVDDVLRLNPSQLLRAMAAKVFLDNGEIDRAVTEAVAIADDESNSRSLRGDAYDILMRAYEIGEDWQEARKALEAWTSINPSSERVNRWHVRLGNRSRLARA